MKKLYRSSSQKMVAGVCGGIAEYFNIDPTIVRIVCALLCFGGGSGILLYILAAILIPEDTEMEATGVEVVEMEATEVGVTE